ncbi:MAG: type I polyketide synthase, partial [Holophaga sp.]|nr:type I polyketide synthase [Holophaga sp.]
VASLQELWDGSQAAGERCVIGSVKSNIGHLLTAAGGAALTKVLLAMRAGTLPPTANFNTPQPGMGLEQSPFRVLKASEPWLARGNGIPRRAAVSAFGFGGINAHLLVEEWLPSSEPFSAAFSISQPLASKLPADGQSSQPIAVVGLAARFGPWQSLAAFQERVLGNAASAVATAPRTWWGVDQSDWFRAEGPDRTSLNGFYQDDIAVAANRFRIPPRELEEMLPQQLLMLQVAAAALDDASPGKGDNLRTGVYIGSTLDLNSTNFSLRWSLAGKAAEWARQLGRELSDEELAIWTSRLREAIGPPLSANRTMGALGSVVASRIAREFKFGGPSFTLSSEESSGVRALETALRQLQSGELDRALVGAVDLSGDPRALLCHHALQPLSPSGCCRPFDSGADGGIIGEGAGAVVLKRLADAERDGDRIYALIRGIGSSGGDMLSTTDNAYGRALNRAYTDAGVDPATVGFIEAASAGNAIEDAHEAATLTAFLGAAGTVDRSCAIASVKADIGHTGAASGLASLIRGCLALYQEIIPACRGIENPCAEVSQAGPLYFPATSRYWLVNRIDGPRRAGVSVRGLDGSCSHVVLEGWDKNPPAFDSERLAPLGDGNEFLFALSGDNPHELANELDLLQHSLRMAGSDGLAALSRGWAGRYDAAASKALALALVARNHEELEALLILGKRTLDNGGEIPDSTPALADRLFYSPTPLGRDGRIAFVFP